MDDDMDRKQSPIFERTSQGSSDSSGDSDCHSITSESAFCDKSLAGLCQYVSNSPYCNLETTITNEKERFRLWTVNIRASQVVEGSESLNMRLEAQSQEGRCLLSGLRRLKNTVRRGKKICNLVQINAP